MDFTLTPDQTALSDAIDRLAAQFETQAKRFSTLLVINGRGRLARYSRAGISVTCCGRAMDGCNANWRADRC